MNQLNNNDLKNYTEFKSTYETEICNLREELKEKNKEVKRLNDAFRTIKQTNETLRLQVNDKQEKSVKLEKQTVSLNNRVANLQVR